MESELCRPLAVMLLGWRELVSIELAKQETSPGSLKL